MKPPRSWSAVVRAVMVALCALRLIAADLPWSVKVVRNLSIFRAAHRFTQMEAHHIRELRFLAGLMAMIYIFQISVTVIR